MREGEQSIEACICSGSRINALLSITRIDSCPRVDARADALLGALNPKP